MTTRHTVDTLLDLMNGREQARIELAEAVQALHDERDRRYTQRFDAQEEAVQVAKSVAQSTRSNIVAIAALVLSAVAVVITYLKA